MIFSPKPTLTIRGPQGSGGGGSLQISSDRDDQMGAKVKTPKKSLDENLTPKKSLANFASHKNFQSNYSARIHGNCHESSDCFEYPKKSLLKSSLTAKNTCQNFPTWKIQKELRSSLSPEIWSTHLGHGPRHLQTLHIGLCEADTSIFQVDTFSWSQEESCEMWHLFLALPWEIFFGVILLVTNYFLALGKSKRERNIS